VRESNLIEIPTDEGFFVAWHGVSGFDWTSLHCTTIVDGRSTHTRSDRV
jgi:hypothetical protein